MILYQRRLGLWGHHLPPPQLKVMFDCFWPRTVMKLYFQNSHLACFGFLMDTYNSIYLNQLIAKILWTAYMSFESDNLCLLCDTAVLSLPTRAFHYISKNTLEKKIWVTKIYFLAPLLEITIPFVCINVNDSHWIFLFNYSSHFTDEKTEVERGLATGSVSFLLLWQSQFIEERVSLGIMISEG